MTAVASIPDSPPDLSGSKSSKSSSCHSSSQLSGPDDVGADISNFEDIVLEDDTQSPTMDTIHVNKKTLEKRPSLHSLRTAPPSTRTGGVSQTRDAMSKRRYPSLRGQVDGAASQRIDEAVTGSNRKVTGPKRGFTTSSVPALPAQRRPSIRSRSQSPAALHSSSSSTYNGRPPPSPTKLQPNPRRGSWQPGRKTIKELEEEYRDSDDELEDDTTLWNVPMSPRPVHERPSSQAASRSGSPERGSPIPPPLPLAHSVSAPADINDAEEGSQILPRNRLPPRTTSLQSPPPGPSYQATFRDSRAKSWTLAMSDLSEEARIVTEALEYHADDVGRRHEAKVQQGSRSARPSFETTKRTSHGVVELPPLQKGNIMIDPLPISKEKEKVLARTRPSWLPPKDPKEEKKHLREYQRMMAASLEAEKKREAKERSARLEKEEARATSDRVWEQYVYPEWNHAPSEHRTRELWWKGVSPKMRGAVWQRAVGNELALTEGSYLKALKRAQKFLTEGSGVDDTKRVKRWFKEIKHDARAAYPALNLFQEGSPMHDALINLLLSYVMYRKDVGYMHGLHVVAASILLQIPVPSHAFILLANCLNRPLSLAFLTSDPAATSRHFDLAQLTLSYKFPQVHKHLFDPVQDGGLSLQPQEVFEPMFRTLLSNVLDTERLARVWDCWVFEGDRTLVRAAVAVLGLLEGQICLIEGHDVEEKRQKVRSLLGWGPWGRKDGSLDFRGLDGGDEDGFMRKVLDAGKTE